MVNIEEMLAVITIYTFKTSFKLTKLILENLIFKNLDLFLFSYINT